MIDRLLEVSFVYRLWQLPFERRKFAPLVARLAAARPSSVLDVGCGPGTNAAWFADVPYVGVDLNPKYIVTAIKRFGPRFVAGDATERLPDSGAPYDFVLVNSLLHHLDDAGVAAVLTGAVELLAPGGAVHILDLELPSKPSAARFLARHDRGDFPRPRARWRELLSSRLEIDELTPYPLGLGGLALWRMFYCRGRPLSLPAARAAIDTGGARA